jgi:proline iminopeptidase
MIKKADFYLKTEDGYHQLAIYERGDPKMPPVIYLHGGPGAGMNEEDFCFFDLKERHVIAFDQRGCGNSKPFGSLFNNLVPDGVSDIELIRKHFNIDSWIVFGGSYGSTLALSYAISHPDRTKALVIRGIFLARKKDIDRSFEEGGASLFHPDTFEAYKNFIDKDKRDRLVDAYYEIFSSKDESKKVLACKRWASWEDSLITLKPFKIPEEVTSYDLSSALLECHFMVHNMGWDDDNYILNNSKYIENIPTYIVQGRYDQDCPPMGAWELKNHLKNVKYFKITEATGHLSHEKGNERELKKIMRILVSER